MMTGALRQLAPWGVSVYASAYGLRYCEGLNRWQHVGVFLFMLIGWRSLLWAIEYTDPWNQLSRAIRKQAKRNRRHQ